MSFIKVRITFRSYNPFRTEYRLINIEQISEIVKLDKGDYYRVCFSYGQHDEVASNDMKPVFDAIGMTL